MAIPPLTHPCWLKLASGGLAQLTTQHLGAKLMTKRIERSGDPPAAKAAEIHAFFTKWEPSLGEELKQLTRF